MKSLRGAILGIALSLVPLVVVLELADGMIEGIMSRFIELVTYHARAVPPGGLSLLEIESMADRLSALPDVASARVEREGVGIAVSGDRRAGATVRAIDPNMPSSDPEFARLIKLESGSLELTARDSAILGSALARKLGVKAGDRVGLLTTRSGSKNGVSPRVSTYRVKGIVSSGYEEIDALWFMIGTEAGFSVLAEDSSRTFIGLKARGGLALPPAGIEPGFISGIKDFLGERWGMDPWYVLLDSQYRSLLDTKVLLLFIGALIVLVASVNVSSAVIMLVIERRLEVAVLKSMGASQSGLTLAFTMAGALIGLIAAVIGMALGIFMAVNVNQSIKLLDAAINAALSLDAWIRATPRQDFTLLSPQYYLVEIPVRIAFPELWAAGSGAIILSAFAAWFPARRTKRIPPLEVLRRS
jgi:lipoprotein-releasing system permease protein